MRLPHILCNTIFCLPGLSGDHLETYARMAQAAENVRILTLNCWGLMVVSSKRQQRLEAIAYQLHDLVADYDIVCLQEVWVEADYEKILDAVGHELRYAKRWYSGIIAGPGLAVFSRWPIESAWLYRFALNGLPSAIWRGDWFVGKSAGSCTILHPSGQKIEVVVAHLHAPYAASGYNAYVCHRASQAWDLSNIVRRSILAGNATFVVGDLNAKPGSVNYRLFQEVGLLSDAWVSLNGNSHPTPEEIGKLSPGDQIKNAGVTSNSSLNTWRKDYALDRAQRLDYVLYDSAAATPTTAHVTFTTPISGVGSVSDHFGVAATFHLHCPTSAPSSTMKQMSRPDDGRHDDTSEVAKLYDDVLHIIHDYRKVAKNRNLARGSMVVIAIVVLIGLLASVWWAARENRAYNGFIYLCAAIPLSIIATTMLFISLLFGRNEQRALTEFEVQIRLAQNQLI